MKNLLSLLIVTLSITLNIKVKADENTIDLNQFAHNYFEAMAATQAPDATAQDIENYLAFLTDDIGHAHLPYVVDDSRLPDGKASMRKGMTFYLASHTEFDAKLLNVYTFNNSAIAIRYTKSAKGIHPQNKQAIEYQSTMLEILEMEGDKVAVIRKYHE